MHIYHIQNVSMKMSKQTSNMVKKKKILDLDKKYFYLFFIFEKKISLRTKLVSPNRHKLHRSI